MDKALVFGTKDCRFESCQGHALRIAASLRRLVFLQGPLLPCQFARVVKGLDLRSNAGNCAWVRTPQLAHSLLPSDGVVPPVVFAICEAQRLYSSVVERQSCKLKVLGSIPSGGSVGLHKWCCAHAFLIVGVAGAAARSVLHKGIWRNGSASDSRSEGWEFESLCPHFVRPRQVALKSAAHALCGCTHIPEVGLEPTISSLGGRRLIH